MIIKIIALIVIILASIFLGFVLTSAMENKKEDCDIDIYFRDIDK